MKNLKFGLLIIGLLLSFPVWFIAEMKKADVVFKKGLHDKVLIRDHHKTGSTAKEQHHIFIDDKLVVPFTEYMLISNLGRCLN